MTVVEFIDVLVPVTLVEMMVATGLGVSFGELAAVSRNWRGVARAAVANYLLVPAVTVGLLLLVEPPDPIFAVGFLIVAVCPGAPFGPGCTRLAKGDVTAAVSLMVILAGSSALVAPMLLHFLLPVASGSEMLRVDTGEIVVTLLATQLVPLCIGLGLRHGLPRLATTLQHPANVLSAVLSLALLGTIFVVDFPFFAEIRPRGYAAMSALLVASLAAGWLMGGPGIEHRKALALTTSLRNVAVGLVIATRDFGGTAAVTAVVTYGIFEIAGSMLLALAWGRARWVPGG